MRAEDTKYSRIEYERRFLVHANAAWRDAVRPGSKRIEDKYLHGTRLRLRTITDTASNERTLKLTKKADSPSAYYWTISRILLSNDELRVFGALPGDRLTKTRHYVVHLDRVFAVDVFDGLLEGLILCEVEASSLDDLMSARPPAFVRGEVTEDPLFSGASLSRVSRDDLLSKLVSLGAC